MIQRILIGILAFVLFLSMGLMGGKAFAGAAVGSVFSFETPVTYGGTFHYDLIEEWWTARVFYGINSLNPTTVTSFELYLTDRLKNVNEGGTIPYIGFGFSFASGNISLSRVIRPARNRGLSLVFGLEIPMRSPWYLDLSYSTGSGAINLSFMYPLQLQE